MSVSQEGCGNVISDNQMQHKGLSQPNPHYGLQITHHLPNIRNYIASRVNNRHDVDDLLQDTLLKSLLASSTATVPVENPLAYSLTVARTVIFDYWNRNRQAPVSDDDMAEPASPSMESEQIQIQKAERLVQVLYTLPPLRRQVFIMRRLHGHSREDIAADLDLTLEAVKKHITRATLTIATEMEKSGY